MAITATHYRLFKSLPLPHGGSLLEIGEANWYGDLDPREMYKDITPDHDPLIQELPYSSKVDLGDNFANARRFYWITFNPSCRVAIDKDGTPAALRHDLNEPLPRHQCDEIYRVTDYDIGQFDVVINHGTAEHIFNIAQVFRTMHDHCAEGGLMVHDAPFTGWIEHGFYCIQPTLFYDLARANCYEIMKVAIHDWKSQTIIPVEHREHVAKLAAAGAIPNNSMLFVALRKLYDTPFKVPMQGVYAGALSEAGNQAWRELR